MTSAVCSLVLVHSQGERRARKEATFLCCAAQRQAARASRSMRRREPPAFTAGQRQTSAAVPSGRGSRYEPAPAYGCSRGPVARVFSESPSSLDCRKIASPAPADVSAGASSLYKNDKGPYVIVLGALQHKREVRHSERSLRSRGIPANARLHQMPWNVEEDLQPALRRWTHQCPGLGGGHDTSAFRSAACYRCGWFTPRAVYQPIVARDSSAPQTPLGMTDLPVGTPQECINSRHRLTACQPNCALMPAPYRGTPSESS